MKGKLHLPSEHIPEDEYNQDEQVKQLQSIPQTDSSNRDKQIRDAGNAGIKGDSNNGC